MRNSEEQFVLRWKGCVLLANEIQIQSNTERTGIRCREKWELLWWKIWMGMWKWCQMDKDCYLNSFLFQGGVGMALFLNWVTEGAGTSAKISFSTPKKFQIRRWSGQEGKEGNTTSHGGNEAGNSLLLHLLRAGWSLCTCDFSTKSLDFSFPGDFPGWSPDFTDPWGAHPYQGVFDPVFGWCLFTLPAGKSIPPALIHHKFALLTAAGESWENSFTWTRAKAQEKADVSGLIGSAFCSLLSQAKKLRDEWWCSSPHLWRWNLWDWRSVALLGMASWLGGRAGMWRFPSGILHWGVFIRALGD